MNDKLVFFNVLKSESLWGTYRIRFENICPHYNFMKYVVYSRKWRNNPPNLFIITVLFLSKQYNMYLTTYNQRSNAGERHEESFIQIN